MHRRLLLATVVLLAAFSASAQAPGIISHQGKLTVNGTNFTGTANFKFALVNAAGNVTFWSDNGTSTGGGVPADPPIALTVTRGIFSVNLGDLTVPNMTLALSPGIFTNSAVYLRTWVNDGVDGLQQLSPDRQIVAVGYALTATTLTGGVADAQIPSNVVRLNGINLFTGINNFTGAVTATNGNNVLSGTFSGNGLLLTNLHGGNAALASNVVSGLGITNPFIAGAVITNSLFAGDGSALTNLNPAHLSPGTAAINISGNAATAASVTGPVAASSLTGTIPAAVVQTSLPSGTTVVSMLAQDASLLTNGYQFLMAVPAPPWVNGSTTGAPTARSGQSAVWSGQQMIVWGGNAGSTTPTYVNTGALYDPVADQWAGMTTIDVPDARSGHTSVWSGTQMIVWGGANSVTAFLNTGGRYQPSPQQWTPVSTASAPAGRIGHIAVWTGSNMFIWGGQNTTGLLNDGALYDPVADAWTTVSLPNAPEARIGATAVWTGDRVIVWGGTGAGGALNDGAELLFSAGVPAQWVATAQTGAPSTRSGHSAIWTGQQMIIWGGNDGGLHGDGGLFNPTANSWTAISTVNAPSARFNHAALWTGVEMLILDGSTGAGEVASGSAYNPAQGLWRTLSASGGPLARMLPGAVWTGSEAVLFGGQASGQPVAALQALTPQPAFYFYSKL